MSRFGYGSNAQYGRRVATAFCTQPLAVGPGHYMITDQERQNTLRELGQCVLDALQKLARYAADKLTPENEPTNVLALLDNPMTEQGPRLRSIQRSLAADRQYLARLTREPFVARLKVEWETEEGTCETLYITRASAAGIGEAIQDARVVSISIGASSGVRRR